MTVAEARAMCAELEVLQWDDVAIERATTVVTAKLIAASPQVTPADGASGTWWVGATGFWAVGGETMLAERLMSLGRSIHPLTRVAIADSCVAARAATWDARGLRAERKFETPPAPGKRRPSRASEEQKRAALAPVILPRGGDVEYLASAPLTLLPIDTELREGLVALGIRTAGGLAAFDAEDVERRWGHIGLAAWRLAHGEDHRRPTLARADVPRAVTAELPSPAETLEPVLFLVRAALERLVADLTADGRAAASVAITLLLDDGIGNASLLALPERQPGTPHTITREVRPARPVARVAPLLEQCRSLLARWTLPAPAIGVTVSIPATAPAPAEQGDLMSGGWRDLSAAEAAFARLRAELGADAVVRPIARDEHRPERAGAWQDVYEAAPDAPLTAVPDPESPSEAKGGASEASSLLDGGRAEPVAALRLLEPPEPVDVEMSAQGPTILWWRGRRITIAYASGPERLGGSWWREHRSAAADRDYWRCDAESEALLVVREEAGWVVQGWFD